MGLLSLRLDDDLERRLAREAERENRSRSEVAREALAAWLAERERQRFHDQLARAARAIDREASRDLADEALPLDNEALEATEPRSAYRAGRRPGGRRR